MNAFRLLAALHLTRREPRTGALPGEHGNGPRSVRGDEPASAGRARAPAAVQARRVDSLWSIPTDPRQPRGREVLRVLAMGVQVFRVESDRDGRPVMRPAGPRADLFDAVGHRIGAHFVGEAGLVWEVGTARVVATRSRERHAADSDPFPELQPASASSGDGGPLAGTTLVERIDTVGGDVPPLESSMRAGGAAESPYFAEYVFYAAPG